ncbi:MAG: Lrp/AsnC family transcriptional regulator [Anaerolineales bacterium]|nr:Lrp/AsnC family transcriptional regulator [Anaerolineales bacterium]
MVLDTTDIVILEILQKDARISNTELARRVNLSPPATLTRVRRLEEDGHIKRYTTSIDRLQAGYDMFCSVHISLQLHEIEKVTGFHERLLQRPEVLECHRRI